MLRSQSGSCAGDDDCSVLVATASVVIVGAGEGWNREGLYGRKSVGMFLSMFRRIPLIVGVVSCGRG